MKALCLFLCIFLVSVLDAAPQKDTFIVATNLDALITLDPAELFEDAGVEYAYNTYDRLITSDPNKEGVFLPSLAKGWEVSPDGKMYTFTLRDDVFFPSGRRVTADDCAFSFQRIVLLNKSPAVLFTQFGWSRENVKDKIYAKDPATLILETDEAFAPSLVLYCLTSSNAAVVDKSKVLANENDGDLGNTWLKTHYAGSGPFQLEAWLSNVGLFLMRNDAYFQGPATLKKVVLRHIKELSSQKMLLMRGDVDLAYNLDFEQTQGIENCIVDIYPVAATYNLSMNVKNPYLQIPEVRQALKYLINYSQLETLMQGKMHVHQSFVPKGFFASITTPYFSYDVEKAKALLQTKNLEKGFTLNLDATNLDIAQSLQAMFAKANITLNILHASESKQLLTKMRQRQHDLCLSTWIPDYCDPHNNAITFMYNPNNADSSPEKTLAWRNSWDTSSFHSLTQSAMREQDTEKRCKQYEELQKIFFESAPYAALFQKSFIIVQRKEAKEKNVRFISPQGYLFYYSKQ